MELDERITDISKIMNCFTTEQAKEYIYTSGYFADTLEDFVDLDYLDLRELKVIQDGFKYAYKHEDNSFKFFLPCAFVKEETEQRQEKKYRPYKNTEEFFKKTNNEIGNVITIRPMDDKVVSHKMIVGYDDDCLFMGISRFSYETLYKYYEIYVSINDKWMWQPFGVEIEE